MSVLLCSLMLSAGLASPVYSADAKPSKAASEKARAEKAGAPAPTPATEPSASESTPAVATELTPQILYQFMLAEIAGARGNVPFAVAAYVDLAKVTQNSLIAKRAAEVALYARQYDSALIAARIWVERDPESIQARQTLVTLLAAFGRTDEVIVHLARSLELDKETLPESLLRINRLFARVNDKGTVLAIVNQVTEPYLALPEAHFARAQAAYTAQDSSQAVTEIDQALAQRPSWEQAALFKALLLQPQGAQSIAVLDRFVRDYPQALDARLALARSLVAEKRFSEARAQFQEVLNRQPDSVDIQYATGLLSLQVRDYANAEKLFRQLVAANYAESNLLRTYLGQIAEETGRDREAIDWYRAVTAGPQFLQAQTRAAQLVLRTGKLDDARLVLQQAATSVDANSKVLLQIAEGQLLHDAKRDDESSRFLDSALAAQPDQPDLLYEAALAADRIGQFERSEQLLRRLLVLKPEHAHAYNALGYSLAERNVRLEEAQQLIDKALSLSPDDAFILDSKGWVQFRLGDVRSALDTLQRAYARRPDPEIAAHLGEVLWSLGRKPDARKVWAEAAKENPSNALLTDTIKKFTP